MTYKYGEFSPNQIKMTKKHIRKQIYFLLLCVDPETSQHYTNINVDDAFSNLLIRLAGFNDLLGEPLEIVVVMSLLNSALIEYKSPEFTYSKYRKLILDAGNEVLKIKEV